MNNAHGLLCIANDIIRLADDLNSLTCDIPANAKPICQSSQASLNMRSTTDTKLWWLALRDLKGSIAKLLLIPNRLDSLEKFIVDATSL